MSYDSLQYPDHTCILAMVWLVCNYCDLYSSWDVEAVLTARPFVRKGKVTELLPLGPRDRWRERTWLYWSKLSLPRLCTFTIKIPHVIDDKCQAEVVSANHYKGGEICSKSQGGRVEGPPACVAESKGNKVVQLEVKCFQNTFYHELYICCMCNIKYLMSFKITFQQHIVTVYNTT